MSNRKYNHNLPDDIFDERSKLLKCQRERLRSMKDRGMSYAELGRYYNIGKSAAYYVCNPDAAARKTAKRIRDAKKYYRKERAVASATKSRNKAKELSKNSSNHRH